MKKHSFYILSLFATLFCFCSCSEIEEAGEYDNWEERNQHFVDSIASLANANKDGWTKIVAYNLNDSVEAIKHDNNHYVYVKKIENGTGETTPMYNDSVRVHYQGRLIPSSTHPIGYVFDKSYASSTLYEPTDVPAIMGVKSTVVGFSTALQHMVEGDSWRIVIPYYLGYGEAGDSRASIPGYSTLIFDIKMARIYRYKIDTNTSWH